MEWKFDNLDPIITKELLLSHYSEETYMSYYLGIPVKKGLFCSPLRKDKSPTCSFYRNSNNELIFKDFNGSFYGNFINVVMYKYSISYHDALYMIAVDFNIVNGNKKSKKIPVKVLQQNKFTDKGTSDIRVEIKEYTKKELNWWGSFGITPSILNKFKVFSCKNIFLNGSVFITSSKDSLIFGYYEGKKDNKEYWRIYFPKRTNYRFLSNTPSKLDQGYAQLPKKGNLLVITKSMKDVMTLYGLGITAIAPNSENLFITDKMLEDLKQRFKYIVVLYDSDLAGISNMNKIRKAHPELYYTWIPRKYNAKDISDFRKMYGKDKTLEFIKNNIIRLKNNVK